jgi:hypothetical protein
MYKNVACVQHMLPHPRPAIHQTKDAEAVQRKLVLLHREVPEATDNPEDKKHARMLCPELSAGWDRSSLRLKFQLLMCPGGNGFQQLPA